MNTATTITLDQARHEANIAARAARLFTTEGYTFRHWAELPGTFTVFPGDTKKTAYIVDVMSGYCQCKGNVDFGTCAHLQACEAEYATIAAVARMEANYAESDAAALDAGIAAARNVTALDVCAACGTPREVNDHGALYFTPCFECESRL